jgi:ribonuclease-3
VGAKNNERLEFLGDAVLECIISLELYKRFPQASEGNLTKLRAYMVKGETLADIAKQYQLGDYLNLGPGELSSGGFRRESILADALEAIIAALFLDGGLEAASEFVLSAFMPLLTDPELFSKIKDPKTYLQELLQAKKIALPEYALNETKGEQHQQVFYVTCKLVALEIEAKGKGDTRRKAEQNAAKAALKQLNQL